MSIKQLTEMTIKARWEDDQLRNEVYRAKTEARELTVLHPAACTDVGWESGSPKLEGTKATVRAVGGNSAELQLSFGETFHDQFGIVNGEIKPLHYRAELVPTLDLLCGELVVNLNLKAMSKVTTEWQNIPPEVLVALPFHRDENRPWDFDASLKGRLYSSRGSAAGEFKGKLTNTSAKTVNWLFKISRELLLSLFSNCVQVPQRGNAVLPVFVQTTRKYSVKPLRTKTSIRTSNGEVLSDEFRGDYELVKENSDEALTVDSWFHLSDKLNATLLD